MTATGEAALNAPHRIAFLIHLARSGGVAQPPALRVALGVAHRGSIAHAARQLAEAGLIQIEGRSIALTPRGRRALAALRADIGEALREADAL